MTTTNVEQTAHNITCPACGLLCDDISLKSTRENTLKCDKAKHFFLRANGDASPKIKGQPDVGWGINPTREVVAITESAWVTSNPPYQAHGHSHINNFISQSFNLCSLVAIR